jgi:hypothetical protein
MGKTSLHRAIPLVFFMVLFARVEALLPSSFVCFSTKAPGVSGPFSSVTPQCTKGQVISSIVIASFGNTTISSAPGACPVYAAGTCQSSTAYPFMASLCLNTAICTITKNTAIFGSPCLGAQVAFIGICGYGGTCK